MSEFLHQGVPMWQFLLLTAVYWIGTFLAFGMGYWKGALHGVKKLEADMRRKYYEKL